MLSSVGVLFLVCLDVHFGGPLYHLDHRVSDQMARLGLRYRTWPRRGLSVGLWFGQRAVVLTGAGLVAAWSAWRYRTSEPLLRLGVAVVSLLVVVLSFKLSLARNAPVQDAAGVAPGHGASFPSGHLANAILLWGLADWSVRRWPAAAPVPEPVRRLIPMLIRCGRWIAPIAVVTAMTLLDYHWISDFVGGAAAGTILLSLALAPNWARAAAALDARVVRSCAER